MPATPGADSSTPCRRRPPILRGRGRPKGLPPSALLHRAERVEPWLPLPLLRPLARPPVAQPPVAHPRAEESRPLLRLPAPLRPPREVVLLLELEADRREANRPPPLAPLHRAPDS
jgi:hypothetical protein